MSDNLHIWNRVSVTSPEHTKQANNGRYSFTCVDPQYQTRVATEVFGPYGIGWGVKQPKFTLIGGEQASFPACMMLEATFWYVQDDKCYEFEYAVDMKYRAGDDCCKKLMTSLQSKCLSKLGFSADVYLGLYDDVQYVKDASIKHSSKTNRDEWAKEVIQAIDRCATFEDLASCNNRVDMMLERGTIPEEHRDAINQALHDKRKEVEVSV